MVITKEGKYYFAEEHGEYECHIGIGVSHFDAIQRCLVNKTFAE